MCRTDQENWPIARRSYVSTDINLIYQASLTTVTSRPQCKASKRVESKPLKNTETITGFTNVAFIEGTIVFLLCFCPSSVCEHDSTTHVKSLISSEQKHNVITDS